jgi:hypothetical protein
MKGTILDVRAKKKDIGYDVFVEKIAPIIDFEQFEIIQIRFPVHYFRHEFVEHIIDHGFSSLFNSSTLMGDVVSPSISINEVEAILKRFIEKLQGAKKLLIIDPYFFAKSPKTDVSQIFKNIITPLLKNLEEICFIDNGRKREAKGDLLSVLDQRIKIHEIVSDEFHDRFWIDPDNNNGIFMGTSLNGLGNKTCLIDSIATKDVAEIVTLAKEAGAPI